MDQLENKAEGAMGQDAMKDMSGGGGGQSGGSGGGMDNTINEGECLLYAILSIRSVSGLKTSADRW